MCFSWSLEIYESNKARQELCHYAWQRPLSRNIDRERTSRHERARASMIIQCHRGLLKMILLVWRLEIRDWRWRLAF